MAESRPVLLALDGSTEAEVALPFALELSRLYSAPLKLIHVLEIEDVSTEELARANGWFKDYSTMLLTNLAAGEAAESQVVSGNAALAVLQASREASFLVVASHGRSGVRATVIGSVADKLVRGADLPVLFVPLAAAGRKLSGGPIIVGLDGSSRAEFGLGLGRELAQRTSAELYLLQAYNPLPPLAVEVMLYPVDLTGSMEEGARAYLEGIRRPGEHIECSLGSPDARLDELAEAIDAGLIVLTSQGKGLAKRLTLGSTTDRVMHQTRRPLLIVPADIVT